MSRDDGTGKGSRSIIWRESPDPFPDPYTDSPVADILPLPGAYPPIREPGDRNPAGIGANRGQGHWSREQSNEGYRRREKHQRKELE